MRKKIYSLYCDGLNSLPAANKKYYQIDETILELCIEKRSQTLSKKWPLRPPDSLKQGLKAIYNFYYLAMKVAANTSATDVITKWCYWNASIT
jgi:vacuolar-type H+-ATPase catalytic subunit A/Vma1